MNKTEAPVEGLVDKNGFTIKPPITDMECILICLQNAPCGIDKKQAERLVSTLDGTLQYASTYDSMGNTTKKIIITYDKGYEKRQAEIESAS